MHIASVSLEGNRRHGHCCARRVSTSAHQTWRTSTSASSFLCCCQHTCAADAPARARSRPLLPEARVNVGEQLRALALAQPARAHRVVERLSHDGRGARCGRVCRHAPQHERHAAVHDRQLRGRLQPRLAVDLRGCAGSMVWGEERGDVRMVHLDPVEGSEERKGRLFCVSKKKKANATVAIKWEWGEG
eukprot:359193-Chlamydomonas_euryale.AAC.9